MNRVYLSYTTGLCEATSDYVYVSAYAIFRGVTNNYSRLRETIRLDALKKDHIT